MQLSLQETILIKRAEELKNQKRFIDVQSEYAGAEYFILKFSDSTFAVSMEALFEITELSESIPLPCSPKYLLGIVNLRGEIIPLYDIHSFLGIKESEQISDFKVVVVEGNGSFSAIVVDDVLEKYHYKDGTIHNIDSGNLGGSCILGAISWQEKTVPLLDIKTLMIINKLLSEG